MAKRAKKKASPKAPPRKKKAGSSAKTAAPDRPFERVWKIVKRIPRGRVATYGQISDIIDRRLTPVGVGWAIRAAGEHAIPWHRVINGRGTVSTDGEHPGLQRAMLEAEGVRFDGSARVDLERFGWRPRSLL
jgi:methylated-DNA-protein-cysteine methyltransferase-like protein